MAGRSNFGAILRDPLVLALLGTNAAINAADSYTKLKSAPDPNTARFVNAAMLQGEPVTSLPKEPGLFTSIGKMFGANPNVSASPETLIQEQLAIQQQRQKQMTEFEGARRAFGQEGTNQLLKSHAFGPAVEGVFPGGVPATALEKKQAQGPKETLITESPVTSEGYFDPTRTEKRVPSTTTTPDTGMVFGNAPRKPKEPKADEDTESAAYARKMGEGRATRALQQSEDLADVSKGGQFYDINNGTRPPKGKFTYGEHPSNFVQLSEKGKATLDDRVAFNRQLDQLQDAVNKKLVDISGMSPTAAQYALNKQAMRIKYGAGDLPKWTGVGMFVKPTDADAIMLESGGKLQAIKLLTNMQHRYPNMKELVPGFEFIGNLGSMDKGTATTQIEKARVLGNSFARHAIDADVSEVSGSVGDSIGDWKSGASK